MIIKNEKTLQSRLLNYICGIFLFAFIIYFFKSGILLDNIYQFVIKIICCLCLSIECLMFFKKSDNLYINQEENYLRINNKKINLNEIILIENQSDKVDFNNTYKVKTINNEQITIKFSFWTINKITLYLGINNIKIIHSNKTLKTKVNVNSMRICIRTIFFLFFIFFTLLTLIMLQSIPNNYLNEFIYFFLISLFSGLFLFIDLKIPYTKLIYNLNNQTVSTKEKIIPFEDFTHYSIEKSKFNSYKYTFYTKNNVIYEHYQPFYTFSDFLIFYLITMLNIEQNKQH